MTKRPDPRELIEQSEPIKAWQAEADAIADAERQTHDRLRELEALYAEALAAHKQAASDARAALKPEPLGPEPPAESEQLRGFLHTLQLARRESRDRRLRIVGDLAPAVDEAWDKFGPALRAEFLDWLQRGEELTQEFDRWHKVLKDSRSRRDTPGPSGQLMRPAPDLASLVRVYSIDPTFDPCEPVSASNGHGRIQRMAPGEEEDIKPEPPTRARSLVAGARQ